MKFEVTILGSSSATPIFNRNPTSQLLNCNDKLFLIDCGEGTQQQLIRFGIRSQKIDYIFISHLHGDHYFGLIGLLSSLHLNGRVKPLTIFGPAPLREIIDLQLLHSQTTLRYAIQFFATDASTSQQIFENNDLSVETFPLNHRIPCTGFKFVQKRRLRKILRPKVDAAGIPEAYIPLLKKGIDYVDPQGVQHPAVDYTVPSDAPRSYAYCSDTLMTESYFPYLQDVSTLYHEATFMHDMLDRANDTFHTTARQAATIAQNCGIGHLLIGHFSARYRDLEPLLDESRCVFPNTDLAIEGTTFTL